VQEVSAGAQNVSAAVEQQTAGVEAVSAAARELSGMATQLQELLHTFRIENEEIEAPSASRSRRKAA
jgi:methyl-accepting chemotaxis protein